MPEKLKSKFIIPIFIPNQGCPHRCIFCKQKTITNKSEALPTPNDIKNTIKVASRSKRLLNKKHKEVAFYGGTFTSLSNSVMEKMLGAVRPYIKKGLINSIRISTRPDSLGKDKLHILESYNVSTVELGVQSMNDKVLQLSNRGHTSHDTINAIKLLRERQFNVGVQLMPGLPGDTEDVFRDSIERILKLKPDTARLYPTLVIRGTKLAQWYRKGKYSPIELENMIKICKAACIRLENSGIPVIRIGLMSSPSLLKKGEIIAGPWHPSFGFLVRSAIHLERVKPYLPSAGEAQNIILHIPKKEVPLVVGYKRRGISHIEKLTGSKIIDIIPDESISHGKICIENLQY